MITLFTANPYVSCFYFICVIFFSMIFMHPFFVMLNVAFSFTACMVLAKRETLASAWYTLGFAFVIAIMNPLFSTEGNTVLFTVFGRSYTLQALVYGFIMAGILISCINWFSCFGKVITTDKFMYMTGGRLPRVTTVLTMVISLIPFFQKKLAEISDVQRTVLPGGNSRKSAFRALNSATAYAFEHAVNLSFSMKNRGYGTGRASRYADYSFTTEDRILFAAVLAMAAVSFLTVLPAATGVEIIPEIILPPAGIKEYAGTVFYVLLLAVPLITKILEDLQWRYLKSKI